MRKAFILGLTGLLLFISNNVYSGDTLTNKFTLQFHINWVGKHYDNYFYSYLNTTITKKHPFGYSKVLDYEEDGWQNHEEYYYRYYYIGFSFLKHIQKDIANMPLFVRCRFDYFHYNYTSNYITNNQVPVTSLNTYVEYVGYTDYTLNSWQLTPGIGLSHSWKFLNFQIGAEIPVYLRGDFKGIYLNTYHGYQITSQGVNRVQQFVLNPTHIRGGYFIGISLFGNLSVNVFKNFSIGIEGSGGIVYVHNADKFFGYVDKVSALFHYPSLNLSYKF